MAKVVFYFDFGSPNAYLSHRVIPQIEQRTGVRFTYVPALLGGIFKLTNNQSPAIAFGGIKNKLEYEGLETKRFVARHELTRFRHNPHFPVNTLMAMRGAVAAQELGVFDRYVEAVFVAMWESGLKMDDPAVFAGALDAADLSSAQIIELSGADRTKQALLKNTEDAVANGVFGSPSFLVDSELFFGKDRLRDVEEEITKQTATTA